MPLLLPLFEKVARRRLPPGFLLSVVSFRALCLALALAVFFEQLCNLFASFFVADGLLLCCLADNFASLFDEGQADEHLRGRLEMANAPFNAATFYVVAVQAVQRQPAMAAILISAVAVEAEVAPKNCFGVVRAFQHGRLQRGKQGYGVLPNVPQLFRKIRGAVVVGRPANVNVTAAVVAAGVDGLKDTFKGCFLAVKVSPAVGLVPLHFYGAIFCRNKSISCAQIGGFFGAVFCIAFQLQRDGPAAARGLASGFCGEGAALKVCGVVAVSAKADTTFMHVCDGFRRCMRLDTVAARARYVKNRDGLAAHFAADTRAGFCSLKCGVTDSLDFYCFVLLHNSLPFNVSAVGPCPVNFLFTGTIIAACKSKFNRQKYQTYYNVKKFFCASYTTVWYDSSSNGI